MTALLLAGRLPTTGKQSSNPWGHRCVSTSLGEWV